EPARVVPGRGRVAAVAADRYDVGVARRAGAGGLIGVVELERDRPGPPDGAGKHGRVVQRGADRTAGRVDGGDDVRVTAGVEPYEGEVLKRRRERLRRPRVRQEAGDAAGEPELQQVDPALHQVVRQQVRRLRPVRVAARPAAAGDRPGAVDGQDRRARADRLVVRHALAVGWRVAHGADGRLRAGVRVAVPD